MIHIVLIVDLYKDPSYSDDYAFLCVSSLPNPSNLFLSAVVLVCVMIRLSFDRIWLFESKEVYLP